MSTLWSADGKIDAKMLAYTVADDRELDARLIRWDILGSLGHLEGLGVRPGERREWIRALRAALASHAAGRLTIGEEH
ncbi:MAG TPA: hypothetical protein VL295_10170, partial [Gemmatimonadales bacterium]|nr:hypothetical protein [Gemmatimonadales bacterium]